jgi:hypothetical protein
MGRAMKKRFLPLLLLIGALSGCMEVKLTDVSNKPKNKHLIGTQYRIIGNLDAYGIRKHSRAPVDYITLVPPPGFDGYEVDFCVRLEHGSVITVAKVMKTNRWLDGRDAFIVTIEGTEMPVDAEIRLELNRGNEGDGRLQLNPAIYRKIDPLHQGAITARGRN